MKKMVNIRNGIIVVLCITIIFMGIGFIVLSMELEKKNNSVNNFDVLFIDVTKSSSTKGGKVNPDSDVEIQAGGKELAMNFTLNAAHDEISYNAIIRNNGSLNAVIVDLIESPDYESSKFSNMIDPVTITYNDIIGKELKPGEEVELKIIAYYNPSTISGVRSFDYKLGIISQSV